jgi:DNA topoisomerase-1
VIVESPAKARTINKYLGDKYVVKASMGHVRDLPKTKFGIDIEKDFEPTYLNIRDRAQTLKDLKKVADSADKVYLAPDPDREGEAIAWHLAQALQIPEDRAFRVTFNEITKRAVEAAFDKPTHISMDRVNAQQARRILDRIVGYKLSPLLWKKIARGLSAGRVQSVAVKLVVEREKEIRAFVTREYWELDADLLPVRDGVKREDLGFQARLKGRLLPDQDASGRPAHEDVALATQAEAEALVQALEGRPFVIRSITRKEKTDRPSPPFATSQLQQQASIQLRYGARRTMMLAQQLYEGVELGDEGSVGLITYMRTDSFRIADDALQASRAWIGENFPKEYLPAEPQRYRAREGAQEAHEAIRPTDVFRTPEKLEPFLSKDQLRLYRLIWNRFVASQMAPARMSLTEVDVAAGDHLFVAKGKEMLFDGHLRLLGRKDTGEDALPADLREGDSLHVKALLPSQHFTEPPPRYSEATLVKALEKKGIGRPSTYAAILSTIEDRGYVQQKERRFYATELGEVVTDNLQKHFPLILDVDFTSQMEESLDRIEESQADWVGVLKKFYGAFAPSLEAAYKSMVDFKSTPEESGEKCEKCGKPMLVKFARWGKFLACSGFPECRNTRKSRDASAPPPEPTDLVCQLCGKPMVIRTGRRGRFVACTGYPTCRNTGNIAADGSFVFPERSDEKCEKCGSPMIIRTGRRGRFLACSGFPKCRNARNVDDAGKAAPPVPTGENCDKCGSPMVVKHGRRGPFAACSGYPKCRNAKPIGQEPAPKS